MRHRKSGRKLNRNSSHRESMKRNLASSIIEHESVKTTLAKAKELRPIVEKLITQGKGGKLSNRKNVISKIYDKEITKKGLAEAAIHLEQTLLGESVGVQDQILTSHGGLNKVEILPSGEYKLNPLALSKDRTSDFEDRILLFYTGVSRFASNIAKKQVLAMPKIN